MTDYDEPDSTEVRLLRSHGAGNIRTYGDMAQCQVCGLAWDTNDPRPPKCRRGRMPIARKITVAATTGIAGGAIFFGLLNILGIL